MLLAVPGSAVCYAVVSNKMSMNTLDSAGRSHKHMWRCACDYTSHMYWIPIFNKFGRIAMYCVRFKSKRLNFIRNKVYVVSTVIDEHIASEFMNSWDNASIAYLKYSAFKLSASQVFGRGDTHWSHRAFTTVSNIIGSFRLLSNIYFIYRSKKCTSLLYDYISHLT